MSNSGPSEVINFSCGSINGMLLSTNGPIKGRLLGKVVPLRVRFFAQDGPVKGKVFWL